MTLDIDDQVVAAAEERIKEHGGTLDRAISDLALDGLAFRQPKKLRPRGITVIDPPPGVKVPVVTLELVEKYRDDYVLD